MTQHRHSFSRYLTSVAPVLFSGFSYASNPASAEAADSQTKPALEWCLHHLPPRHSYLPGQQPSGPMVDMVQELARASGFTLTFSPPTPPSRCLKLLEEGKTDLMLGLVYTEERNAVYWMAPFDEIRMTSFFVAPHSPTLQRQQDLRGRRVVLTKDRVYPASFTKLLRDLHIEVIWGKDLESALALLLYQQAEIYAGPLHYTELELKKNPRFQTLKLNDWQLPADPSQFSYLAMSRQSPHRALWPVITAELQKMVDAGKTHFY